MLIIGTTSSASQLEELGLVESFDRRIQVPNLTKNEILNVLKNYECNSEEREKIANLVQNSQSNNYVSLLIVHFKKIVI